MSKGIEKDSRDLEFLFFFFPCSYSDLFKALNTSFDDEDSRQALKIFSDALWLTRYSEGAKIRWQL